MSFYDRTDAGRRLAAELEKFKGEDVVVFALPRGGAPVAEPIAVLLKAPLDLVLVRKIGVPFQPELAMGAVADGGAPVIVRNEDVIAMADVVGSTSQLIAAARDLANKQLIVATDNGIFYKMQQAAPDKELIEAPTGGTGASCRSCGHCPWMAMNDLPGLARVLESGLNEIQIPEEIRVKALRSTQRMLDFAAQLKRKVLGSGTA